AIIPKIIGGKIFSDSLARLSFILLLLFSIPVGFHHQLTEPGIDPFWKYMQVVLTFLVVIPSLMTAFSLFATFEARGRELGGKGLFGWVKKMPWKDARFLAPFVGMLWFIPGGAGGIINASNQMNQVVHNTIWVTGHFHLTAATSVMLTFFGLAYWLIPSLTGRTLTPRINRWGIIQTIVWSVGMAFMSGAMHWQGLLGGPRRSAYSEYLGHADTAAWGPYQLAQAVGGSILFIGMIIMLVIFVNLAFFAPKGEEEFPIAVEAETSGTTPAVLENWKLWIGVTCALILFAYTFPFLDIIQNAPPGSSGFNLWLYRGKFSPSFLYLKMSLIFGLLIEEEKDLKKLYISFAVLLVFGIGLGVYYLQVIRPGSAELPDNVVMETIFDEDYAFRDMPKKARLIEFMYTNCPDVCPTTTLEMSKLRHELEEEGVF